MGRSRALKELGISNEALEIGGWDVQKMMVAHYKMFCRERSRPFRGFTALVFVESIARPVRGVGDAAPYDEITVSCKFLMHSSPKFRRGQ